MEEEEEKEEEGFGEHGSLIQYSFSRMRVLKLF